ncbi:phage holin family protein [Leucobacter luti]|uniref:Putative superfamily III holin-X n=1 Tax=Leucobacter luti TaxID=340320 RepID=A0A4Q7TPV6_9MICO|nr:phage holin family protein [Leucobacter luti]MBL3700069.1 phage holin family protein [Leucobacter luti]RZT62613.1 putative superfamily III holin-X [Leucobacter luti]
MRNKDQAGTFELLSRLPQQVVSLAKIEYDNAKREIASKAKKAGIGAGAITIALFFVFFMLQALVMAAIAALALVWPWWLAALVVAAALLVLAAVAVFAGVKLIQRGNPVPEDTLDRVGHDVAAMSDVRFNSTAPTAGADRQAAARPTAAPRPTPGSSNRMPRAGEEGNWR